MSDQRSPYVPSATPPEPAPGATPVGAAPYDPASYAPTTNAAGRLSLALGIVVALIGVATSAYAFMLPRLMRDLGYSVATLSLPLEVLGWVSALVAIGALAAGIAGLRRQGAPKGAAGAGTALGATTLINFLLVTLIPFLY